ncbi:MAG: YvcK family protein [Desulfobacteraceae bacterium]
MTRQAIPSLKITTIGGGSGQYALLSGLKDLDGIAITAVVSMVDSGGSTGRLRDELGILPPGDVLKCTLALSPFQDSARRLLQKRFTRDRRLKGHNAGNMLLTMLSRYTGSFPSGVAALSEILDVKGTIYPVTTDQATLVAELTDGTRVYGEHAIDVPRGHQREKIKNVFLVPHHNDQTRVYPPVVEAIETSDYLILGPGDLFTSIIPNLIVPGVKEAILNSKARLIYIINIMTKFGETHTFKGSDFLKHLEQFTQRRIDIAIYNSHRPNHNLAALYAEQKSEVVEVTPEDDFWMHRKLVTSDLLEPSDHIIRHDPKKLSRLLSDLFCAEAS